MVGNRYKTWNLLRHLNTSHFMPWVVGGDFNEILEAYEKTRVQRVAWQMEGFCSALDDCGLQDLDFSRYHFT